MVISSAMATFRGDMAVPVSAIVCTRSNFQEIKTEDVVVPDPQFKCIVFWMRRFDQVWKSGWNASRSRSSRISVSIATGSE